MDSFEWQINNTHIHTLRANRALTVFFVEKNAFNFDALQILTVKYYQLAVLHIHINLLTYVSSYF